RVCWLWFGRGDQGFVPLGFARIQQFVVPHGCVGRQVTDMWDGTSRICWVAGHEYWMRKLGVVESRICGGSGGFWRGDEGLVPPGCGGFWGWVSALICTPRARVFGLRWSRTSGVPESRDCRTPENKGPWRGS
ncbi:MAG: hypothetical protein V3S24_23515, partial [Candidatus Tectomicrobia bacterium]